MTKTMMFEYGVSAEGAFLVTVTETKHSGKKSFLQINFTEVYAMSQNGRLAFNACREKSPESYNLQKQAFLGWPIPGTSVLPAEQKNLADKHYFGTLHRVVFKKPST